MKLYEIESEGTRTSPWGRGKYNVLSYREELVLRQPGRVDERYRGGAFGCPGDYFEGAPAEDCRPPEAEQCRACWDGEYRDEEWIDDDE